MPLSNIQIGLKSKCTYSLQNFNMTVNLKSTDIQKTLQACAANMGSKISLLVYEWPLIKTQSLVYEWVDFSKIVPNLNPNWLKFGWFCSKVGPKLNRLDWNINGSLLLEKLVFVWVYFQILRWHVPVPTKTKLEYPPGSSKPTSPSESKTRRSNW